jgi:hypothetical protein
VTAGGRGGRQGPQAQELDKLFRRPGWDYTLADMQGPASDLSISDQMCEGDWCDYCYSEL